MVAACACVCMHAPLYLVGTFVSLCHTSTLPFSPNPFPLPPTPGIHLSISLMPLCHTPPCKQHICACWKQRILHLIFYSGWTPCACWVGAVVGVDGWFWEWEWDGWSCLPPHPALPLPPSHPSLPHLPVPAFLPSHHHHTPALPCCYLHTRSLPFPYLPLTPSHPLSPSPSPMSYHSVIYISNVMYACTCVTCVTSILLPFTFAFSSHVLHVCAFHFYYLGHFVFFYLLLCDLVGIFVFHCAGLFWHGHYPRHCAFWAFCALLCVGEVSLSAT